jgi:predicted metal-dependent hydrolase
MSKAFVLAWGSKKISIAVHREQRSTLRLKVDSDGSVEAWVPTRASDDEVFARLKRRAGWIDRQLLSFSKWQPRSAERNFLSGETHFVLGRAYRLHVRPSVRNHVTLTRPRLVMEVLPGHTLASRRGLLDAWYAQKAREALPSRVSGMVSSYPGRVTPGRVIIRAMKARWGSFTSAGNLVLNRELVQVAPRLIDYVIAHELTHALHPDHGARWKAVMTRVMPDWRDRKAALERALL